MSHVREQQQQLKQKRNEESTKQKLTDNIEVIGIEKTILKDLKEYYGDYQDTYSEIIRKLMQVAEGKRKKSTVIEPKSSNRLLVTSTRIQEES
jgi:hypothetical protein